MISYGLEIEAVYDANILGKMTKQDYHHGGFKENSLWKLERDGSLDVKSSDYKKFGEGASLDCGEFITKRIVGREGIISAIDELQYKLFKGTPLDKCMSFNISCGAHVHFSIRGKCRKRTHFLLFKEMREMFFTRIQESELIKARTKTSILKHYFREYAQQTTKENFLKSNRRMEFNFESEEYQKGMEWRSINLKGVTSWQELREVFNIVVDCVEFLDRRVRKYEVIESIKLSKNNKDKVIELTKQSNSGNKSISVCLSF
jgi:hypothetical protein